MPTYPKRSQAARWYDREAAATGNSAIARMFPVYAARIRAGDADHRLDTIIAGQAEYDRGEAS